MIKSNILIALLVIIIGIFYIVRIREGHNWGDDFSVYIHHAKNIAEGVAYQETGYIYSSPSSILPKTYPPVFPLLLTPIYMWFGLNFTAMKIEIIVFFLLSLFMIYLVLKDELPFHYLIAMIAIIGFNYYFLNFLDNILSDIPFMFFIYASLFFIKKIYQSNKIWNLGISSIVIFGFLFYLVYGIRSIGAVLIFSLIIYDIVRFKKPTKFVLKLSISFLLFAILQNLFLHSDYARIGNFLFNPKTIFINIVNYTQALFFFWYNGYTKILQIILFSVISCLAAIGYFIRIKRNITIVEVFLALYIISLAILPGFDLIRYIIPVIPLYLFYALWAITNIDFPQRILRKGFVFVALIIAIFITYIGGYKTRIEYGPIGERVTKREALELFDYIKKETNKNDVFVFQKPGVLSLFSERNASVYGTTNDDKELLRYFHRINAKYIVAGKIFYDDETFLIPFLNRYKDNFQEIYSNSDFIIYMYTKAES